MRGRLREGTGQQERELADEEGMDKRKKQACALRAQPASNSCGASSQGAT